MTSFTRRSFVASVSTVLASSALGLRPSFSQSNYPSRPITLICPWGAGGGTDATARIIAQVMEQKLSQPVNVVNRTGGNGVVGHSAISAAAPDGYTIGLLTVEIAMMHWQGLTELTPRSYAPLSLMNVDAPAIQVKADSPYKNIKELADAIKAAPPGKMKASGTGQGGIWHLALVGWLQSLGLQPNHVAWVPSNGAAPGMQDLAAGGIDIVPCSLPEARPMIDAGRARSLAILAAERNPQFPNVPTLDEQMGPHKSVGVWRGIAGPKGLPPEIQDKLVSVLKEVYASKEYKEFMSGRGFGIQWAEKAEFGQFMDESDRQMGEAMKAAGLAKA